MNEKPKRKWYEYRVNNINYLTETKDLKKFIKINVSIIVGLWALFIVGLICGLIFISQESKNDFIVGMIVFGVTETIASAFYIWAILRAAKKIKKNESENTDEEKQNGT